jgi:hypothetical protein
MTFFYYLYGRECTRVIGKPLICMLTCEQCRRARDHRRDTRERSFQKGKERGQLNYSIAPQPHVQLSND